MISNSFLKSFELDILYSLAEFINIEDLKYFDCTETMERSIEITLKDGNILKFSLSINDYSSKNIIKSFKETFPEYFI